jgi:ketosteroid isomerase-like protein
VDTVNQEENSMDALEDLIARSKIQQLVQRYALAVDGKDLDGIAELFPEDVDNGRHGVGREGVKNFYDQVFRGSRASVHFVGNHVIEFDDADHAHGVVYCQDYGQDRQSDAWHDMTIAYWDFYERHGDDWLFRRRIMKRWSRPAAVLATPEAADSTPALLKRGVELPEYFPHHDDFLARPPRPLPGRPDVAATNPSTTAGGS